MSNTVKAASLAKAIFSLTCLVCASMSLASSGTSLQTQVNGITFTIGKMGTNQATVTAYVQVLPYPSQFPSGYQYAYGDLEVFLTSQTGQKGAVCSNSVQQNGDASCSFLMQMPEGSYTLEAEYQGTVIGTVTYLQSSAQKQVVVVPN